MREPVLQAQPCPFCPPRAEAVFYTGTSVLGLWDAFAVTPGHALLVTKAHRPTWFDATDEERRELASATSVVREAVLAAHPDVSGFNLGVNIGQSGGQTVPHLHVHVIPRREGDVADPRGGVRTIIPGRGLYGAMLQPPAEAQLLVTGEQRPLLPELKRELETATDVDIAVAFVVPSGLEQLLPSLEALLARGGALRVVTGDYLDFTEPAALRQLLDLRLEYPAARFELRVFVSAGTSFHPKAYVLKSRSPQGGAAFVGSSNLTLTALRDGVEWNYRVVPAREAEGFSQVCAAFEALFKHPRTRPVDDEWVKEYEARRRARPANTAAAAVDEEVEPLLPPPPPHEVQLKALEALSVARAAGFRAGLVAMATGLGKTWLSAFDSERFGRVLFVAHREEILSQALRTYRRVRPGATFGRFDGEKKVRLADVTFASIQTLARPRHLETFAKDAFDYIVVDEFHHASAQTYRRVIEYFQPKFLLGLTATPERTDGGDLLSLCGENLVYSCGIPEGIRRELLAPYSYFGVPDTIDYANIPWRSTHFDEEALTREAATGARAQNTLEEWKKRGGQRTLAFCVSQRHADFMRDFFLAAGVPAASIHSGAGSDPRQGSLERLESGELRVVFSVDIFNEGVDVPAIDTVMMLRPTESAVVWLQQFGRGLRRHEGKTLKVIDYIGNHRAFLLKARTLLGVPAGNDAELNAALQRAMDGALELPPGCSVTYELEAVNIMRALLRLPKNPRDALREYYLDFRERRGVRPTATEALHDGYNPRSAANGWFGLVEELGDLTPAQARAWAACRPFLDSLAKTEMSKSYKMVLLLALLNADGIPGEGVELARLVSEFRRLAGRDPRLRGDVSVQLEDDRGLRRLLEQNPIEAWVGARGTSESFFSYEGGVFRFLPKVTERSEAQQLIRELTELRLAMYLEGLRARTAEQFALDVSHAGQNPILFLPDRKKNPALPSGWVPLAVEGQKLEGNFVKVALNVVREPGKTQNELPRILRGWFGADAGLPGTSHRVVLERSPEGWSLAPLNRLKPLVLERWASYSREQIPGLLGDVFSDAIWNVGFVVRPSVKSPKYVALLVTLEKGDMHDDFQYGDRFLSRAEFEWQSQNRTTQASAHGQLIQGHARAGVPVHLFVRKTKRDGKGQAAPFIYCGPVTFESWQGEKPVTVKWKLEAEAPAWVLDRLGSS
jgi:superfamily II DNA or RNA helicase/HKD family nuclease/diadenosine tetraphosphate (Ap4A) HIT family hydrolase